MASIAALIMVKGEHRTGSKAEQCAPDKRNAGNADECCQKAGNGSQTKAAAYENGFVLVNTRGQKTGWYHAEPDEGKRQGRIGFIVQLVNIIGLVKYT